MRGFFFVLVWRCGATSLFCFFRDEEWALTMDIFFFRRPLSTSIDAHSLLSLTLALSFFLSFLSLSTDNNNFTKDKVLSSRAKQQRAKQNPKKKKTRPRLLRKIYPQDFLSRSISFLPMAFSPTPPQNPKKKKQCLPGSLQLLGSKLRHDSLSQNPTTQTSQLPSSLRQSKASKKYDYFFTASLSFFLPAHILHNQNPF